jgi:type I site-specific deoxyribonuclease, hsdR family
MRHSCFVINDKCKDLAKRVKELINVQSSFTNWLNNDDIRKDLNKKIFFCQRTNGYSLQYNTEALAQVMKQIDCFYILVGSKCDFGT